MTNPQPFRQTWADDFFTSRGFTMVPNALLEFAAQLDLSPAHTAVISALLYWKWDYHKPYPSVETLAEATNRSPRSVQRLVRQLEAKGLIAIQAQPDPHGRQGTNLIDFTPLREAINALGRLALPGWAHDHLDPRQSSLPFPSDSKGP